MMKPVKKPVAQKDNLGCGAACLAFVLDGSYETALRALKAAKRTAKTKGFYGREIAAALRNKKCGNFTYCYIKPSHRNLVYLDKTIVFVKRSKRYPQGHYLCRYRKQWMDSWINFGYDRNIKHAQAGFRKRLPGKAIYMIYKAKKPLF